MAEATAAERGREVRRKLLDAAGELIVELGWRAVSTRVLAERAGIGSGLVHYHFASLQALLTEAAIGRMSAAIEEVSAMLDGVRTPEDVLELLMGAIGEYSGQDAESLLFVETYLAATRDEELQKAVAGIVDAFRAKLASALARAGVAAPADTAAVLAAAIDGVLLHRALDSGMTAQAVGPILRRILGG
ncbi:TetR/AcrR family transcriptional regulator [Amycolatopsis sp. cg5]|uniref:TetR/AcrR family transcriptional regulator n=1 Tax=Amycolatopsis sp. cg5 TaxID=3238802 RepID=UPI00352688DE